MAITTIFEFGPFRLDTEAQQLYLGQEPIVLQRKPFLLLKLLLQVSPAPLQKEQIMEELWPETYVDEGNVYVHIHTLRALFKKHSPEEYIGVIRGVGFRFLGEVTTLNGAITAPLARFTPPASPAEVSSQERRAWQAYANAVIDSHLHRPVTEYPYARRLNAVPTRATMGENFHSDAVELLLKHLAPRTFTFLVGEYGSGKTYTAGALAYRLAKNFIENPDGATFLPVILPLRHASSFSELGALLPTMLVMQYGFAGQETLLNAQRAGRLALILDGLDEMLSRTDRKDVFFHLNVLIESTFFATTPILITTRPNIIPSASYYHRLGEAYKMITLDPLDPADVVTYLKQEHLDAVLAKLKESYDSSLGDLLSRPLYVEMIIATADRIANLSGNESLRLRQLYDFYFEYWYERELRQLGRPPGDLDCEVVRNILSMIALRISVARKPFISVDSVRTAVESLASSQNYRAIDTILTAAKERLILVPTFTDMEVQYSFRHESLRSYFYAAELARRITSSELSDQDLAGLDMAAVDFLFGFIQGNEKALGFLSNPGQRALRSLQGPPEYVDVLFFLWDRQGHGLISQPRIHWLCSGPEHVRGMVVSNLSALTFPSHCTFEGTPLANGNFRGSTFEGVTFQACDLTEGDFRGASLPTCSMLNVALDGANFQDARLSGSNLGQLDAKVVNFSHATMLEARLSDASLTKSDFRGAIVPGLRVLNSRFVDCDFRRTDLRQATFERCHFLRCLLSKAIYAGSTFLECTFLGCDLQDATKV
jgi:DNA-binding winged helix-turn-helix (wHTH) protein